MASLNQLMERLDAIERRMEIMHEDIRRIGETVNRLNLQRDERVRAFPRIVKDETDNDR